MKPAKKLRLCNRWLGFILLIILVSGIQLEATSGRYVWPIWVHIILGTALILLSLYHIFLHYSWQNWFSRFAKNRNTATRVLWWTFLLTAVSGIAATVHWLNGYSHSYTGAIHGKIGFVMAIAAIVHAARHLRKRKGKRFACLK